MLEAAERLQELNRREALAALSRTALEAALATPPPKTKRYALPTKPREAFTPWAPSKIDLNAFRSEILSFLHGAAPQRDHRANMAEVPKLWGMCKSAASLEEAIECAKSAIRTAEPEGRIRSMSEESAT